MKKIEKRDFLNRMENVAKNNGYIHNDEHKVAIRSLDFLNIMNIIFGCSIQTPIESGLGVAENIGSSDYAGLERAPNPQRDTLMKKHGSFLKSMIAMIDQKYQYYPETMVNIGSLDLMHLILIAHAKNNEPAESGYFNTVQDLIPNSANSANSANIVVFNEAAVCLEQKIPTF